MRANTSILTGTAEVTANQEVQEFENLVAGHVGGDWSQHTQMRLYTTQYAEPITGHIISDATLLRIQLTGTNADGGGDGVFTLPAIDPNITSAPASAPIIIQQPENTSAILGAIAGFRVVAISPVAMTYQWLKNGVQIAGATSSVYIFSNAIEGAVYSVIVTNNYGSTTSASATLTILPVPPEQSSSGGSGFDIGRFFDF